MSDQIFAYLRIKVKLSLISNHQIEGDFMGLLQNGKWGDL